MHIVLLCATNRGYRFLEKLISLKPYSTLTVFSFKEEKHEPPFIENIRALTLSTQGFFFESKKIHDSQFDNFWNNTEIDLIFIVSWRYMIPHKVYSKSKIGTFVFHDSMLPQYRGFSPTVWAMINGESYTGVTLFEISETVDAGDIVDQTSIKIDFDHTIADVVENVTNAYLFLLEKNLYNLAKGQFDRSIQNHALATYTCKRLPEDNKINWHSTSLQIYNFIRAVSKPYSGAYTFINSKRKLIIWSAKYIDTSPQYIGRIPGRVIEIRSGMGSIVLTNDGALFIEQVQFEGNPPVCAAEVLNSIGMTLC